MSDDTEQPDRPDPRTRPDDPAGTKPKVDSQSLLPAVREPLVDPPAPPQPPVTTYGDDGLLPEPAAPDEPPAEAPHSPRFQFLLGALFALGLAAIAAVVALAVNGAPEHKDALPWSAWKPTAAETAPAEIAQYVAERYQTESGKQLVNVTGGPLQFQQTPLELIVDSGLSYFPLGGQGVLFNLCGIGAKDCRIATGKPSMERALLLRREIVELALYTFHYTDADNVVAVMPLTSNAKTGKYAKTQNQAVLLQRQDLEDQLKQPIDSTLAPQPPRVETVMSSPDINFVESLTSERDFKFKFQAAGTDGGYMVLEPVA
ncbi:MAG: hypothetical protein ACJ762_19455 [Solirubrobacteraceae bacterium]